MANERKDQDDKRQQEQQGGRSGSESGLQQQQGEDNRGKTFRDDPEKAREAGRKGGQG
jgi:uncharacterized protein